MSQSWAPEQIKIQILSTFSVSCSISALFLAQNLRLAIVMLIKIEIPHTQREEVKTQWDDEKF